LYDVLVRKHIVPAIGNVKLHKMDAVQLRALYAQQLAAGVGIVTIQKVHGLLHRAFADAVIEGSLTHNVAGRVTAPKAQRKTRPYLTNEQIEKLLAGCNGQRLEALFMLAVFTGMREGELLALQWDDIDFSVGSLSIKRAWRKGADKRFELGPTKTPASARRIALPEIALERLSEHRRRMIRGGHGSTFVFCTASGTPIHRSNLLRRELYPLLSHLGLPRITFHDLRHSAASALLALGTHPKIVQERLGHTDIRTTMNLYSHSIPTIQAQAARVLDDRFGGKVASPRPTIQTIAGTHGGRKE
jgi:integrase